MSKMRREKKRCAADPKSRSLGQSVRSFLSVLSAVCVPNVSRNLDKRVGAGKSNLWPL